MSYLVTGGAGFIGSHIVEALLKKGRTVRVLDNFATGRRSNLDQVIESCSLSVDRDVVWTRAGNQQRVPNNDSATARLTIVEGDIRDPKTCAEAINGVDYVLHQAALASVPRSIADPIGTTAVNVTGTLNVLWAAKEAKVKRVVYASSSSVYGDTPVLPKVESLPTNPLSPYAVAKLAGEQFCKVFFRAYGLPTVALRYFNVYGPRQDPESQYAAVIPRFVAALKAGRAPTIFGDGTQSRDFTFVADCVKANLLACESLHAVGEAMNVAYGERTTLNALYAELARLLKSSLKPEYADSRPGDVKHSLADLTRAETLLGYKAEVDIKTGVKRLVEAWTG